MLDRRLFAPVALLLPLVLAGCAPKAPPPEAPAEAVKVTTFNYPTTQKVEQVDEYFGTAVPDPYRWLESPDTEQSRAWIEAQNTLTNSYLGSIPERELIRDRLTALWNHERYSTPWKMGDRYFFYKNDGLQDQSVLYVAETLDAEPRLLIDPNTFSEDGTISLADATVSWDGRYVAYSMSDGGSDWRSWKVRDVETGADLADELQWTRFTGVSWTDDNSGFYYSRYPETENPLEQVVENQMLYYHKLGTPQSEDRLIYEDPEHPRRGVGAEVSEDGDLLWLYIWEGTEPKNRLYYQRLDKKGLPKGDVVRLLDAHDAQYWGLTEDDGSIWLFTNKDAPRGRIVKVDIEKPAAEHWVEVVPEGAETIDMSSVVGDTLFVSYLKDAHTVVRTFGLDGKPKGEIALPGVGSAGGFSGLRSHDETFYWYSDYTTPSSLYHYDLETGRSTLWKAPDVDFDSSAYVTEQVFYPSKDGTKIPMFIIRHKDTKPDGENPTLLYGYGGFNIPMTPGFKPDRAVWLEMGGVYVVANLRGGGEYGEDWHQAGIKLKKQNVFDDFIAAAEYLVQNNWTRPDRLAINGRSNGGLLVGAVMTQRPDLFGAALPGVGVLDMLRYHDFTIGWAWASDYGRADESEEMFRYLHGYSPVHNVKPGTRYPSTMVHTADHDDRVVPGHSFKFTAALQEAHAGENPVLIRIETRAGHGAGMSTTQKIEEAADLWAFLVKELDFEPQLPGTQTGADGATAE